MTQLEERFNQTMEAVRLQAKSNVYSSVIKTDFPAYKDLTNLGLPVLPYLRKLMGRENEPRWEILMATRDIIQDSGNSFLFPSDITGGDLVELESYMKGYLDCRFSKRLH